MIHLALWLVSFIVVAAFALLGLLLFATLLNTDTFWRLVGWALWAVATILLAVFALHQLTGAHPGLGYVLLLLAFFIALSPLARTDKTV